MRRSRSCGAPMTGCAKPSPSRIRLAFAPGMAFSMRKIRRGTLRVRSFATPDAIPGRVVLYFHGGGFVVGGLDSHDSICADLAAGAEVAIVALDYRLSPEHIYPAALDDAEAAYDDLLDSHQAVILAGDSAGATLTVALCLRLRRKGKPDALGAGAHLSDAASRC